MQFAMVSVVVVAAAAAAQNSPKTEPLAVLCARLPVVKCVSIDSLPCHVLTLVVFIVAGVWAASKKKASTGLNEDQQQLGTV
jgi:hypothetical protein